MTKLLTAVALLATAASANAANIGAEPRRGGYGSYIFIVGDIVPGDSQRFANLNPPPPVYVRPKSRGGSVDEAIKIADMIHARGYSTLVANRDYDASGFHGCASACTIIWLSGYHVLVQNRAYLQFHSCSSPAQDDLGDGDGYKDNLGCNAEIADHLQKYGYTAHQAWALANASPHVTARLGTKMWAASLGFQWQTIPSYFPGVEDWCQAKFCLAFP